MKYHIKIACLLLWINNFNSALALLQGSKQKLLLRSTAPLTCADGASFERDTLDCSVYYQCLADGTKSPPFTCEPGLVFNQPAGYCDYVINVPECSGSTLPPTQSPTTGPIPSSGSDTGLECPIGVEFVRDPVDCAVYYQCLLDGYLSPPFNCEIGLVFNEIAGYCDYPSNVNDCPSAVPVSTPTNAPVVAPTMTTPTGAPVAVPTTSTPTSAPVTVPTTSTPTSAPVTVPTTSTPTTAPTTAPVTVPTASTPTSAPVTVPTASTPTSAPVTAPTMTTDGGFPLGQQDLITNPPTTTSNETYSFGVVYERGCYFTNWAQYRNPGYDFRPSDIDPQLCTTIYYAFAAIDSNFTLQPYEWNDEPYTNANGLQDGHFAEVIRLKKQNPRLRVLLSVGGWNFNDCTKDSKRCEIFSDMAATAVRRDIFIQSSIALLRKYGFDGLDLDWEFPAYSGHNGLGRATPQDKQNLVLLVKEFRDKALLEAYTTSRNRLMLTAAVGVGIDIMDGGYDVAALCHSDTGLDHVNLMSYDYHGAWDPVTGHNSPLYSSKADLKLYGGKDLSCAGTVDYWIDHGCSPKKLVLGLSTYGRGFKLKSSSNTGFYAPASGPSPSWEALNETGIYTFTEIKKMIANGWLTDAWDADRSVPYAYNGTIWVGYDNEKSVALKAEYIKSKGLLGGMVWTLDFDDFGSKEYPLLRKLNSILLDGVEQADFCEADIPEPQDHGLVTVAKFPEGVWDGADCSLKTLRRLPGKCSKALNAKSTEEERLACQLITQPYTQGKFPLGMFPPNLKLDERLWTLEYEQLTPIFNECALAKLIDESCLTYRRNSWRATYEDLSMNSAHEYGTSEGNIHADSNYMKVKGGPMYGSATANTFEATVNNITEGYSTSNIRRVWSNDFGSLSMDSCMKSPDILLDILNQDYVNLWKTIQSIPSTYELLADSNFIQIADSGYFVPSSFRFAVQYVSDYHFEYAKNTTAREIGSQNTVTDENGFQIDKAAGFNPTGSVEDLAMVTTTTAFTSANSVANGQEMKYGDCRFDSLLSYPDYWSVILGACAQKAAENFDNLRPAAYVPKDGFIPIPEILDTIGVILNPHYVEAINLYFAYCRCTPLEGEKSFTCYTGDHKVYEKGKTIENCNSSLWWLRDKMPFTDSIELPYQSKLKMPVTSV